MVARFGVGMFVGMFSLLAADPAQVTVQPVVRAAGPNGAVTQYMFALPHIAYGDTWRTKIVITNTSSTPADVSLQYFGSSGAPLSVPFGGVLADHTNLQVPANGSSEVEPDRPAGESTAWVGLVYTNTGVKVQGVFLWHNPADPPDKYTEAAAPVISQSGVCIIPLPIVMGYSMPYDETGGRFSGYAFANTTNTAVTMSLTFYDEAGQLVGQYSQQLPGFGHDQFLLKDKVPAVLGKKGVMKIGGAGVVPLGFRFTPYYTFTTWQP